MTSALDINYKLAFLAGLCLTFKDLETTPPNSHEQYVTGTKQNWTSLLWLYTLFKYGAVFGNTHYQWQWVITENCLNDADTEGWCSLTLLRITSSEGWNLVLTRQSRCRMTLNSHYVWQLHKVARHAKFVNTELCSYGNYRVWFLQASDHNIFIKGDTTWVIQVCLPMSLWKKKKKARPIGAGNLLTHITLSLYNIW